MRKTKPKTRQDLFVYLLNKWRDNEEQCVNEWCIRDRQGALKKVQEEYEEFLDLWQELP